MTRRPNPNPNPNPNLKIWRTNDPEAPRIVLNGHEDDVWCVALNLEQTAVVTGSGDRSVRLWDAETGEEACTCLGHTNGVRCVAFSPDSSMVASGSWDKTVRLWDCATGRQLATLHGPN